MYYSYNNIIHTMYYIVILERTRTKKIRSTKSTDNFKSQC